ncbi:putative plasma membrane protein [Phytophthora palmivora]|uniref:Plasma membrane protein n=1 Tax=Phytophthora palmivora TaxID=4796 RepID=A0A2P4X4N1_9STRA|nr:putative plasma membrane protein [Phytophthora palmivora]
MQIMCEMRVDQYSSGSSVRITEAQQITCDLLNIIEDLTTIKIRGIANMVRTLSSIVAEKITITEEIFQDHFKVKHVEGHQCVTTTEVIAGIAHRHQQDVDMVQAVCRHHEDQPANMHLR